jgi:hypothetical protein
VKQNFGALGNKVFRVFSLGKPIQGTRSRRKSEIQRLFSGAAISRRAVEDLFQIDYSSKARLRCVPFRVCLASGVLKTCCLALYRSWKKKNKRKSFRWCAVKDYPPIPCGGLHVKNANEIGELF